MRLIEHNHEQWIGSFKGWSPIPETIIPLSRSGMRKWRNLGDEVLVAHAIWLIVHEGIDGRIGLLETDPGLYNVLTRRKLLDETGLPSLKEMNRDWARVGTEEIIAKSKEFITKTGIKGRNELAKADAGLYKALLKRNLLGLIGLPSSREKYRGWSNMGNDELVAHAKMFMEKRGITGRAELRMADYGLHRVLRKRKLMKAAFSVAESSKRKDAVDDVLDAIDSFGDGR